MKNPALGVRYPAGSKGTHRALTQDEIDIVANNWHKHRTGIWIMIMLFAGLRRGEMMALKWSDIDFENQMLTVNSAIHFEGNKPVLGKTKTAAGKRTVPIPLPLFTAFQQKKAEGRNGIYVCQAASGGLISQTALRYGIRSFLVAMAKIADCDVSFRCHDLRHTYATFLYDLGIDLKTAQYYLGHAEIKMTMQIYTHLSEQRKLQNDAVLHEFTGLVGQKVGQNKA